MKTTDHYIIRVKGSIGKSCRTHFEGLTLQQEADGNTSLSGWIDQSGLHGVLMLIRDLGLKLLQVEIVQTGYSKSIN